MFGRKIVRTPLNRDVANWSGRAMYRDKVALTVVIGNTQISILLLYFLYLFVELMITMNESI